MEQILSFDRDSYLQQLQNIHALRDALGLSVTEYRRLLKRLTGSTSAKYMTFEQRQRVISVLETHQAIDQSIEQLEHLSDTLNRAYDTGTPSHATTPLMDKRILLDGQPKSSMSASLEEVILSMRHHYGNEVRLVGIRERRIKEKTILELSFERSAQQRHAA